MPRANAMSSLAAALVLVVGMGFGRFAYTGLYPLMLASGQISVQGGSYAAAANYAGYLLGALAVAVLKRVPSRRLCTISVIATVVLLGLLYYPLPEWTIILVRGAAGAASAMSMVAASQWLIHDRGYPRGAPALFAGVGVGILISAEMIALSRYSALSSYQVWAVLTAGALIASVLAMSLQGLVPSPEHACKAPQERLHFPGASIGAARLVVIYGLAGFGYIITATYLPLLVRTAFGSVDPVHIWAIFGLGAVPSCFLWHRLHERWDTRRSLMLNLVVQAIGVALPATHTTVAYMLSAVLVGGTFMGTVTIAIPAARRLAADVRFDMLAVMTAAYGVGQIIGPLAASRLYAETGSFDLSLLLAAGTLIVASVMCIKRTTMSS